jgi:adenosine deaminase
VYHAGETRDPMNENIEIAVKGGSVRIGHGINILQRMEFLNKCKEISFEVSPISNMLTSLRDDTRIATAPVLMSLGYALTINPDDPGKFGYEDSTVDYFSSFISFNWSLKELKLLGIHSINHSICSE